MRAVSLLFVFDMDDVLYDYDWRTRMQSLTDVTGHDLHELRRRWWISGMEWEAEAGRPADADEYLAGVTKVIGAKISRSEWVRMRAEATQPRPEALDAVRRATELGRVSLLTNNSILMHEHLHDVAPELVPLMGREHMHASAAFGARKPDPLVFERVLEHYNATAAHTFFADDLIENVAGAESVGITGHHYTDAALMLAAIEVFAAGARTASGDARG
jgi:HAD superfamily hydrolase (TIGR01509 family)